MPDDVVVGRSVQTPLGKGVVREVRRNGRLLVEIADRAVLFEGRHVRPLDSGRRPARARDRREPFLARGEAHPAPVPADIDLHGLTVDEALARVEDALNAALLTDASEIRLIHGGRTIGTMNGCFASPSPSLVVGKVYGSRDCATLTAGWAP